MTSNERKLLKCLWDEEGKVPLRLVAERAGFTADFARLLCGALARSGHIKLVDANTCYLLKRGRARFQVASAMSSYSEEPTEKEKEDDQKDESAEEPQSKDDGSKEEMKIADAELKTEPREETEEKETISESGTEAKIEDIETREEEKTTSQETSEETGDPEENKPRATVGLKNASPEEKEELAQAGYKTPEDLAKALITKLIQGIRASLRKATSWINQARQETSTARNEKTKAEK